MQLALFDFDETLIKENSLAFLFKAATRKKHLWFVLFPFLFSSSFWLLFFKKGLKYTIKYNLYHYSLKGLTERDLLTIGHNEAMKLHPLPHVLKQLKKLHSQNIIIWIVTATPTPFVKGLISKLNWPVERVIGTELHQINGVYTGYSYGECQAEKKVLRLQEIWKTENLSPIIIEAYGNLPIDIPMLKLAQTQYSVIHGKLSLFNAHNE
jgi:HAD superfamily phosphoserine phosphatase-like hydrolase